MSRRTIAALCLVLCFAVSQHSAPAQSSSPKLQTRPPAEQHLVFDVIEHTRSGAPIALPEASSLRLRIDGKPVPTAEITVAEQTPQLLFVLDAINTPRADLVRSIEALLAWLHASGERLPFDTSVLIAADVKPVFRSLPSGAVPSWELIRNELYAARFTPTRNPAELAAKLNAYDPGLSRLGSATEALSGSERVQISLQALSFFAAAMKDAPAPKLMLWISPGWPFVHMTEGGYAGQLFDSAIYFDDALRAARIVLYALDPTGAATDHSTPDPDMLLALRPGQSAGPPRQPSAPGRSDFYKNFLTPVRSARDADPNTMVLPVLALHSGGTVQTGSNDLLGGIIRFAADAGFVFNVTVPTVKAVGKEVFHTVQIEAPGQGEDLRTRIGFYAR